MASHGKHLLLLVGLRSGRQFFWTPPGSCMPRELALLSCWCVLICPEFGSAPCGLSSSSRPARARAPGGSGVPREHVEAAKATWGLRWELAQNRITSATSCRPKLVPKLSPGSKLSLDRKLQSHLVQKVDTGRARDLRTFLHASYHLFFFN